MTLATVYRVTASQLSAICLPADSWGEPRSSPGWQTKPGFIEKKWCRGAESNCRHHDFQSCALPTELPRHARDAAPTGGAATAWRNSTIPHRDRWLQPMERGRTSSRRLRWATPKTHQDAPGNDERLAEHAGGQFRGAVPPADEQDRQFTDRAAGLGRFAEGFDQEREPFGADALPADLSHD